MRTNQAREGYRLSPQQRREWNRRQEGGGGRSVCLVRLEGEAEEARVRRSLREVVKRQEILRSRYEEVDGMSVPVQVIESEGEVEWEAIDVSGEEEDGQEREVRKIYRREREREVNYERGPLVRAVMVTRGEGRADLVIGAPVICSGARPSRAMRLRQRTPYSSAVVLGSVANRQ